MQAFIAQANGPRFGLRAAVYEFECGAMLTAFGAAAQAGADVQIVYDAVANASKSQPEDTPRVANEKAIDAAGIRPLCTPRTHTTIAHNKFIVLLEDGAPVAVWTGSTNFTEGGIYGQWNVGHVVRDSAVATRYLELFGELKKDEAPKATRDLHGRRDAAAEDGEAAEGHVARVQSAQRARGARLVREAHGRGAGQRLPDGRVRGQQGADGDLRRAEAVPPLPAARQAARATSRRSRAAPRTGSRPAATSAPPGRPSRTGCTRR